MEEIQRRDRRLRKAWKDYGSVESVKKEKKKVVKVDTSNLYSEEKEDEDKNVLRSPGQVKEEKVEKGGEENEGEIPEEEKLEE